MVFHSTYQSNSLLLSVYNFSHTVRGIWTPFVCIWHLSLLILFAFFFRLLIRVEFEMSLDRVDSRVLFPSPPLSFLLAARAPWETESQRRNDREIQPKQTEQAENKDKHLADTVIIRSARLIAHYLYYLCDLCAYLGENCILALNKSCEFFSSLYFHDTVCP